MSFWIRKTRPWYKKLWDEWRQLFVSLTTIFGLLGSAYAYFAVDVVPFTETTDVYSVATRDTLYVQIDVIAELEEQTFIVVNLDGQQVASRVYPKGVKEGEIIIETPIPFTSEGRYLKVNVEIIVVGPRTLFKPTTLETTLDVERQGVDDESSNTSTTAIIPPTGGIGI